MPHIDAQLHIIYVIQVEVFCWSAEYICNDFDLSAWGNSDTRIQFEAIEACVSAAHYNHKKVMKIVLSD